MKKYILIFLLLLVVFIAGCSPEKASAPHNQVVTAKILDKEIADNCIGASVEINGKRVWRDIQDCRGCWNMHVFAKLQAGETRKLIISPQNEIVDVVGVE